MTTAHPRTFPFASRKLGLDPRSQPPTPGAARMELQVSLRTLLDPLPGLRFAEPEEDVVGKTRASSRAPERMPITWEQP
ncbi:hypothetical protein [Nonomuraea sp. NEAU-A123]|uniref:hypothetical protein n=1 Tax=Nonomuraea sp. NEAU-A123 TaxID=2839649 RepID=UPI001BE40DF2|nr:hypothetical protein [Nonomuraea sp. NEAU-A123]MBT2225052.1 hypothetical protein [Nonomuraea sp. NEAU-A123]